MAGAALTIRREVFPIAGRFVISRGARTEVVVVVAELTDAQGHRGRGECVPYARYGESVDAVVAALEALAPRLATGLDRAALLTALPAGAARNALDCALWDLAAKQSGQPAWALAGLAAPAPLVTAYTLSLDTPEAMAAAAATNADRPLLKMKLGGAGDRERVAAVRAAAPAARLIVDANEGWSADDYDRNAQALADLGVALIEQPLPAAEDEALAGRARPVPLCADESVHDRRGLDRLARLYDLVNLKLDKTGGLTEALATRAEAEARGLGIMVGCMLATSLAMAPAVLLAQGAAFVDLDGPLLLARDRLPGLSYTRSTLAPPESALWG